MEVVAPSLLTQYSPAVLALFGAAWLLVAFVGSWWAWRKDPRPLLAVLIALSVIQVFWPAGNISVFLLVGVGVLPGLILRTGRRFVDLWLILVGVYAIWELVSLAWSKTLGSPLHGFLALATLGTMVLLGRTIVHEYGTLSQPLRWAAPWVALECVLVLVFRFFPEIERAYLYSGVAQLLSEPEIHEIGSGLQENILEATRAGGLLLNGNIAALMLALVLCLYGREYLVNRGWAEGGVAVLAGAGMLATGSKSPLLLAMVLPLFALVAVLVTARKWRGAICVVAAAGSLLLVLLFTGIGQQALDQSVGDRVALWGLALELFPDHWFLGLGHDAWAPIVVEHFGELFGPDRIIQDLPPHNLILQSWVDAGVIAALLTLMLAVGPGISAFRGLISKARTAGVTRETLAQALVFVGVLWAPIHGLMDTTAFFGENHTLAFYAVLVGVAFQDRSDSVNRTGQSSLVSVG